MFFKPIIPIINEIRGTTTNDSAKINSKTLVPFILFKLCCAFLAILNSPHRQSLL